MKNETSSRFNYLCSLVAYFLMGTICIAQNIRPFQIHVPTSPQAEAFMKYGEHEINPATGTPNISIPLHTIEHYGYSIPLSLKYAPTPLKPGYNYDVFGQGWSLSVNSSISRTIEYVPDELSEFRLNTSKFNLNYANTSSSEPCISCLKDYNYAFDKFNVVLPDGSSFDFIIDNTNYDMKYVISDNRLVKVTCFYDSNTITSFTVVDEGGITYTFEGSDRSFYSNSPYSNSYVSWILKKIELPNSTEPIEFSYDKIISNSNSNSMSYEGALTLGHFFDAYYWEGGDCTWACSFRDVITVSPTEEPVSYSYVMRLLTSITYGNRGIYFNYKNTSGSAVSNYVDKITFLENQQQSKVVELNTAVVNVGDNHKDPVNKLNSLFIKGIGTVNTPEIYQFEYSPIAMTSGIDPWGYCNNMSRTALPPFKAYIEFDQSSEISQLRNNGHVSIYENELGTHPYTAFNLSNSGPANSSNLFNVGSKETHGILKKIIYPTGGYAEFEFENHRFLTSTNYDGTYIQDPNARVEAMASGFRIRTIKNYASNGKAENIKNYFYGERMLLGSQDFYFSGVGKVPVDPTILTYMSYSNYCISGSMPSIKNMVLGLNESGSGPASLNHFGLAYYDPNHWNPGDNEDWSYQITFCGSNFRRLLDGRSPILYPKVTVVYGSLDNVENLNGKTVYEYNISDNYLLLNNDGEMFEQPSYYGNTLSYIPRKYSYPLLMTKEEYSFDKGLYLQQTDSDECFKLKERETYLWNANSNGYVMDYVNTNPFPPEVYQWNRPISNIFQTRSVNIGGALTYLKINEDFTRNIQTSEYYNYFQGSLLSTKTSYGSSGKLDVLFEYPVENTGNAVINKMLAKHMKSTVLKQTTKLNDNVINSSKVDYKVFGSGSFEKVLPGEYYSVKTGYSSSDIPDTKILSYTPQGNPKEVISRKGEYTIYLWSYNERYLLAEIKVGEYSTGVYSAIEAAVATVFQVSNIDALAQKVFNDSSQTSLILQQQNLRTQTALKDAFVTTYTYNRFGKPTSITPPSGLFTHYEYDDKGKLERVRDGENNILGENKYNYKQ